jgi:hypothetical protein
MPHCSTSASNDSSQIYNKHTMLFGLALFFKTNILINHLFLREGGWGRNEGIPGEQILDDQSIICLTPIMPQSGFHFMLPDEVRGGSSVAAKIDFMV